METIFKIVIIQGYEKIHDGILNKGILSLNHVMKYVWY